MSIFAGVHLFLSKLKQAALLYFTVNDIFTIVQIIYVCSNVLKTLLICDKFNVECKYVINFIGYVMKAKFARLRSSFVLIIASVGLILAGQAWAQSTTLEQEKAKLVGKFAKLVEWPEGAIQSEFIIGVYKNTEKYEYFRTHFANKGVKNKDISVRLIDSFKDAKDVNILYIPSGKKSVLQAADRSINGRHVLIVTENSNDIINTMVDLRFDEDALDLIFNVNYANVIDEEITFPDLSAFSNNSSNNTLPDSPTFAREKQQKEELAALQNLLALQKTIEQQKASLSQLNKQLDTSEKNAKQTSLNLQKNTKALKAAQEKNTKQTKELTSTNNKLKTLSKQLDAQKSQLATNSDGEVEPIVIDDSQLKEQEQTILDLTEQLKKQKSATNNNAIKLATLTKENKALSNFEMLLYVFIAVSVIALLVAFLMWKKAKDAALQSAQPSDYEDKTLLPIREEQLGKSENIAALGYIATDVTYAVGTSLTDIQEQLEAAGDTKNAAVLKPVVSLLDNFNMIAADQDDTEVQSFDVIAYIQKMVMLYEFEFSQSDIAYDYSGEKSLTIKSVPGYIALVLLHIINNSLKHGFDNNGNGKISLKTEKGAKGGVKITYSDSGKGMSKATLKQVFEPFFTTHSDRGYVGVGMSTTYDVVKKKLAGDIKIDSQEGKGTTVTITLP